MGAHARDFVLPEKSHGNFFFSPRKKRKKKEKKGIVEKKVCIAKGYGSDSLDSLNYYILIFKTLAVSQRTIIYVIPIVVDGLTG